MQSRKSIAAADETTKMETFGHKYQRSPFLGNSNRRLRKEFGELNDRDSPLQTPNSRKGKDTLF